MQKPYLNRGLAKVQLEQYAEATKDFGACFRLKPDYPLTLDSDYALAYYCRGAC